MLNNQFEKITQISIFLFFSTALLLPSGYSWPPLLIFLTSLFFLKKLVAIKSIPKHSEIILISIAFLFFGLMHQHTFESPLSFNGKDYIFKYIICIFIFFIISKIEISYKSITYGLAFGGIPLLALSIFEYIHSGRADGYTNAIQFGGISTILALLTFICILNIGYKKSLLILASLSFLGFIGSSIFSLSRGGWLLILILPFLALFTKKSDKRNMVAFCLIIFISCFLIIKTPIFQKRYSQATEEYQAYTNQLPSAASSSIGQRLEQWKLARNIFQENVLFGTGEISYDQKKLDMVNRKKIDPSTLNYRHSHNEVYDTLARKGIFGFTILALFYIVPFMIFTKKLISSKDHIYRSLSLMGAVIPLSYFIMGLTQMVFAHNSGHMFYIFSIIFIHSALSTYESKIKSREQNI